MGYFTWCLWRTALLLHVIATDHFLIAGVWRHLASAVLLISNFKCPVAAVLAAILAFSRIALRSLMTDLNGEWRPMIRKLKSGQYRLYSRKIDTKTGKRRNLGTFPTRVKAERHERAVHYFKRRA
jgi:hypothetical protein